MWKVLSICGVLMAFYTVQSTARIIPGALLSYRPPPAYPIPVKPYPAPAFAYKAQAASFSPDPLGIYRKTYPFLYSDSANSLGREPIDLCGKRHFSYRPFISFPTICPKSVQYPPVNKPPNYNPYPLLPAQSPPERPKGVTSRHRYVRSARPPPTQPPVPPARPPIVLPWPLPPVRPVLPVGRPGLLGGLFGGLGGSVAGGRPGGSGLLGGLLSGLGLG